MIEIFEATTEDLSEIREIAYKTWPYAYGEILKREQIDYMLDLFYAEATLKENILEKGHFFLLAKSHDTPIGFASFEHHYTNQKLTRLHKLYVLPEAQGKAVGRLLVAAVELSAHQNKSKIISLNVNKFNKAFHFYRNLGFETVGEQDIELAHGYLMEDYKMEKVL
ncbi:MAG: GNAT family N-acetyltransferase [Burkholderiales bacterium]|nr:GNAT family N-acetyltransferase [Flavobacterium sp.]